MGIGFWKKNPFNHTHLPMTRRESEREKVTFNVVAVVVALAGGYWSEEAGGRESRREIRPRAKRGRERLHMHLVKGIN